MNEVKELVEELRNKKSRDNRELLDRSADMIEKLAKELCDKSGCCHKYNDIKDYAVGDKARQHLPSALTNEEKDSAKYFTPSEVRKMTPKEVRENYDLIIQSMKRWN